MTILRILLSILAAALWGLSLMAVLVGVVLFFGMFQAALDPGYLMLVPVCVGVGAVGIGLAICCHAALHLMRRKFIPGMCPACQYDLRRSSSTYCPECGASFR